MSLPTLTPSSTTSAIVLTSTGSLDITGNGAGNPVHYPLGLYIDADSDLYDSSFINGASDQVAFTYKKLGGDVLDIELTVGNIYAAYEEAVLEYSYQINTHQAKNVLSDLLGMTTGTFDHDGSFKSDSPTTASVNLKYPRFQFEHANRVQDAMSFEADSGGHQNLYSASFKVTGGVQDYDLQRIISASSADNKDEGLGGTVDYAGLVGNNKVSIKRVYYKTTAAMWRFYGYYGGVGVVGNFQTYGQYADDSTFEVIPAWQNKLQAMAYEDSIYTRTSHFSYEVNNNKLRLYPTPSSGSAGGLADIFWVAFSVKKDSWEEYGDKKIGIDGVNNMNTAPFDNLPYSSINSIGKQWIRSFALALSKETLGQIRSKFSTLPIPGESLTLNGPALITEAKETQNKLREELRTTLDEMTYNKLMETDALMVENVGKITAAVPLKIFVG
jgi:hypothetical protein